MPGEAAAALASVASGAALPAAAAADFAPSLVSFAVADPGFAAILPPCAATTGAAPPAAAAYTGYVTANATGTCDMKFTIYNTIYNP